MEQSVDLSALTAQQIDPEVFRRVWARVMPDDQNSPIAVAQETRNMPETRSMPETKNMPEARNMPEGKRVPRPNHGQPAQTPKPQPPSEEALLRQLMDLAQEGITADAALARRAGNQSKALAPMAADHHRAMRQLSAAYYLLTGKRYQPKASNPVRSPSFAQAMREQFQWEQRWNRTCLQAAERMEDHSIRELCRELAGDGVAHNRMIRGIMERL